MTREELMRLECERQELMTQVRERFEDALDTMAGHLEEAQAALQQYRRAAGAGYTTLMEEANQNHYDALTAYREDKSKIIEVIFEVATMAEEGGAAGLHTFTPIDLSKADEPA